jgi:Uroporphyrinogen-III decarboxylase
MKKRELLNRIWNLERANRPGIIIEESHMDSTCAKNAKYENWLESELFKSKEFYKSLESERDDNIPALNCSLGTYVIPSVFGAGIRSFTDGRKYIAEPIIKTSMDIDKMKPLPIMETILGEQIKLVEYFVKETKGEYPIRMPDIQNPLGVAEMLWETNDFYMSLIEEPEKVHKLLEMITEVVIEYAARVKRACPSIVPISWPFVWAPTDKGIHLSDDTMSMVSPKMYEEFGVFYNNIISREFGGLMLHSCTMDKRYFSSIAENEGLRSINFAAQYSSDMSEIFGFFGGKTVIIPHYVHTDSPQIGTVTEFIEKVGSCWRPETPTILFIASKPDGGRQEDVFSVFEKLNWRIPS